MEANKIIDAIDSVLVDLFGKASWHALRYHIAEVYNFDVTKPEEMVRNPELFEKILTDLLGSGAPIVFERVNQKLTESFSIKHSERFAYSQYGDYGRLVKRLKSENAGGKTQTKDVDERHD